jgi:hypothetical protein
MKKHLRLAALAAAITTTAALAEDPDFHCDTSSANFQAAAQRAAQQALQAQIDDAEWYQRHNARRAREAAEDAAIMNYFSEQNRRNRESLNALWQAYFNLQRQR